MPRTTPEIKVDAVRSLGAEVVLVGDHYAEAQRHAETLAPSGGLVFIHPFDDPLVIAGQGTVAVEMLRQCAHDLTAIFVPVGGGGLIAGHRRVRQGADAVDARRRRGAGRRRRDGAVARRAATACGWRTSACSPTASPCSRSARTRFRSCRQTVDEIVRVDNDEVCAAIKDIFDDTRTIMEPAGALALAGLKAYVERDGVRGARLAAVLSGANMNFDRLRFVAERAEIGEGREALLAVTIPERPGAFGQFCRALGNVVVTEFNYRLSGRERRADFRRRRRSRRAPMPRALVARLRARAATRPPTSPTTRWRSCTCGTWSAAGRRTSRPSASADSSSRSGPAR